MSDRIHYTSCPVCDSTDIKNVFPVKDYTVSGETFMIVECNSCTLRFTQDVPDQDSIAHYYKSEDYISHTNTSKGLINRLYKAVRKRTINKKRKLIEESTGLKNGSLLDLGSGVGTFVHEMKQHHWQVTGLEMETTAREAAQNLYNVELKEAEEFYKLSAGSFDVVTLWHVLEHVHDLNGCMQQLKVLMKENGKLFIAVPNYTSYDASVYKEFWAAYDVPRHLYHFSPKAMKILIDRNDMQLWKYESMWYDSFYISMLSNKYKSGNSNLINSLGNGWRSNIRAKKDPQKCSSVIYIVSK